MWTIIGVGIALAGLGTGGFTLLWRYIAAAEKRSEDRAAAIEKRAEERSAAVEKRAEERSAAVEKRAEARFADLKADLAAVRNELKTDIGEVKADLKADMRMIGDRMERNHRHADPQRSGQAPHDPRGGGAPHGAPARRPRGAALSRGPRFPEIRPQAES